jgi:hypothetical protein
MQDYSEIIRENESLRAENKRLKEELNKQKNSKSNIYTALAKAQGQFQAVAKNQDNPFFKSKYLTLAGIMDVIRKPFADNGLCVIQSPKVFKEGNSTFITLKTIIAHSSGDTLENELTLPIATGQRISDAQAIGSGITYARRYALQSLLGISADEEDDDGNSACNRVEQKPKPKEEKKQETQKCCKCGKDIQNRPLGTTTYFDYSLKELGGYYCKDCGQARKKEMETGQSEMIVA